MTEKNIKAKLRAAIEAEISRCQYTVPTKSFRKLRRCRRKAVQVYKFVCGCGKVQSTHYYCGKHRVP